MSNAAINPQNQNEGREDQKPDFLGVPPAARQARSKPRGEQVSEGSHGKRITIDLETRAAAKLERLRKKRETSIKQLIVDALSLLDAASDDRYEMYLKSKDNGQLVKIMLTS